MSKVKRRDVASIIFNKSPYYLWGFYVHAIKNNIELTRSNVEEWINNKLCGNTSTISLHKQATKEEMINYIYDTLKLIEEETYGTVKQN